MARPENERSFGLHEPIGPANIKVQQYAVSGVEYTKQKYIDPLKYDEGYFDFRCTEIGGIKGPPNVTERPEVIGTQWYAICGKPFENHAEYVVVIWSFCAIAMFAFYNAFARSAGETSPKVHPPQGNKKSSHRLAGEQKPSAQQPQASKRPKKKKKTA